MAASNRVPLLDVFRLFVRSTRLSRGKKVTEVGKDQLGNTYYEAYQPEHKRVHRRYFVAENKDGEESEKAASVRVPPAWQAWLQWRRKEAPTEEEIRESEEYFEMQQARARKPSLGDS